jgi:DNA mismatch repair protein MutL
MPQAECNDPDQITREVHAPQESPARGAPSAVQFHDSYIVAACEDGIEVIDQHALHERVIYNDLKRRLADGAIASQRLLIPQTLTVTAAEAACAEDSAALLGRLGFDLVSFGPRTLAIQAMPALFAARQLDGPAVVREVLDRLSGGQAADAEAMLEGLLEVMACKAAVKAGDPLGRSEIEALLRRRRELDKASACPHGRPTTLKISLKELEKQFKRI